MTSPYHRFFLPSLNLIDNTVEITTTSEIHHIHDVLRLKKGDFLCLFNGLGDEADAEILLLSKRSIQCKIIKTRSVPCSNQKICLACAIPKRAKFETIIEKCTELGVDEIIPLKTIRTEINLNPTQALKKTVRYQTVAINAAKQSKRLTVPTIKPITTFLDALSLVHDQTLGLIACLHGERKPLRELFHPNLKNKQMIFFVGPEGDFTNEEIDLAIKAGCQAVDLGPTVLKVDTAAMAIVSFARLSLF